MAEIFTQVARVVSEAQVDEKLTADPLLRGLDHRARRILGLFARQMTIRSADVAGVLGCRSVRRAPSRRARKYALAAAYRRFIE